MGSTGSGMFGTYRGDGAGAISGGSINGGGDNQCPLEIENINLEDVAISDYYLDHNNVPDTNLNVILNTKTVNGRLVIVLVGTNEIIGNLPVKYNYLNLCIKKGKKYSGHVISSGVSPIPYVVVNLYAI